MPHDDDVSMKSSPERAFTIKVDDRDNVAIVVNARGLPAGTRLDDGTVLLDTVPQGHKVALADMAEGAPVLRYGEVIGYAARTIARGTWIDESLVLLPEPPALDDLPLASSQAPDLPALDGVTFEGYRQRGWHGGHQEYSRHHDDGAVRRADGRSGTADQGGDSAAVSARR